MSDMTPSAQRTTTRRSAAGACATTSDDRYEQLRRPCPVCGQLGLRIVYGYPSGPLVRSAARGQLVLGGCTYRDATHRCPNAHDFEAQAA